MCIRDRHGAWLEEDHPALFARLQEAVASGAVVPVGGMWVEPDGNLLAGESVCRQLAMGARWFRERLGHVCQEVWLPDSFGSVSYTHLDVYKRQSLSAASTS